MEGQLAGSLLLLRVGLKSKQGLCVRNQNG